MMSSRLAPLHRSINKVQCYLRYTTSVATTGRKLDNTFSFTLITMKHHELLILGAGWTSTFLIPLARARKIGFAATTRDGRDVAGSSTLKWSFDPEEKSDVPSQASQFAKLPLASTILVTFPLTGKGQSKLLKQGYDAVHASKLGEGGVHVIQLGSTGIWQIEQDSIWSTRHSPYNTASPRAVAEDELLSLGGCVLNLAGLWGGERQPKNWVGRVAKNKEDVKGKKSLHIVHGQDVARSVLAVVEKWGKAAGQRWMVTDGFVYVSSEGTFCLSSNCEQVH